VCKTGVIIFAIAHLHRFNGCSSATEFRYILFEPHASSWSDSSSLQTWAPPPPRAPAAAADAALDNPITNQKKSF
jgi:hypothetical protein